MDTNHEPETIDGIEVRYVSEDAWKGLVDEVKTLSEEVTLEDGDKITGVLDCDTEEIIFCGKLEDGEKVPVSTRWSIQVTTPTENVEEAELKRQLIYYYDSKEYINLKY